MRIVSILDTSICDNNLGNQIIMDSVNSFVKRVFPNDFLIRLPYLDDFGQNSLNYIKNSAITLLGGTNALSADLEEYSQIGLNKDNRFKFGEGITLMGVGWWQYQNEVDEKTADVYSNVFSTNFAHSVRDNYTKSKLEKIGFENVINTGCPSMWNLNEEHCDSIPKTKANNVLCTLTNYNQNKSFDRKLVEFLSNYYEKVFFWIQGPEDLQYINSFGKNVEILPPRLEDLDDLLISMNDIEYVGTRLHAGIRALQYKKRSLIIGIDNRAIEMSKDFNIPLLKREDLRDLKDIISSDLECKITIPESSIKSWKSQFEDNQGLFESTPKKLKLNNVDKIDLSRVEPISRKFGFDLGTPVDRYYIENFLSKNSHLIIGNVLEFDNDIYARKFGNNSCSIDILSPVKTPKSTIVADLCNSSNFPENRYNCIICTQTIQVIFDIQSAIENLIKALLPGGNLILTVSGISQISRYDYERWGEYWRLTEKTLTKLAENCSNCENAKIMSFGNLPVAKAFLDGIPAEFLQESVLDHEDKDFQLIICGILRKQN